MHNHRKKNWERSYIKCDPYVERETTNRRGETRIRSTEEMIRVFNTRVKKSGHLSIARDRRAYRKPSEVRRAARERRSYEIQKHNEREARAHAIRKQIEHKKRLKRRRGDRQ